MSASITVIMPTHNNAPYLAEAVESAASQGVPGLKIIIVDDGSTDDTPRVAAELVKKHGPATVHYLRKEQGGVAAARNSARAFCDGKYVAFLDGDDVWLPGSLRVRIDFLEKTPEAGLVCADAETFNERGIIDASFFESRKRFRSFAEAGFKILDIFNHIVRVCFVLTSTVVVRRECLDAVGWFDESLKVGEDKEMYFRIARKFRIMGLPEKVVRRRIHGHNLTADQVLSRTTYVGLVEMIRKKDPAFYEENRTRFRHWLGALHHELGYQMLGKRRFAEAASRQIQSLYFRPSGRAAYYLGVSMVGLLAGGNILERFRVRPN